MPYSFVFKNIITCSTFFFFFQKLIKSRFFKIMNTSLKLGAFDHAFSFSKKKKKIIKILRFPKKHAFIFRLGAFSSTSFK